MKDSPEMLMLQLRSKAPIHAFKQYSEIWSLSEFIFLICVQLCAALCSL